MAVKKYVRHHWKWLSCLAVAILMLAVGGAVVLLNSNSTKADVYIKDEDNNYEERQEITILEIVAQDGQQVFGYTVAGSEPVSPENIAAYTGNLQGLNEFQSLSGYTLSQNGNKYTVTKKNLYDIFNKNVLRDSMAIGQIKVKAVQAKDLTAGDIHGADLIFINTNNYGANSLYYYDQFVKGGALNITPDNYGANYDTAIATSVNGNQQILETMKKACGRWGVAKRLTVEDFQRLGVKEYRECNHDAYLKRLKEKNKGAFDAVGLDDAGNLTNDEVITNFITSVNNKEFSDAMRRIKTASGSYSMTAEQEEKIYSDLIKMNLNNVYEVNKTAYVEKIIKTKGLNKSSKVQNAINAVVKTERSAAVKELIDFKALGKEYDEIDDSKKVALRTSILKIAYPEINPILAEDYAVKFMSATSPGFKFENTSNEERCLEELKQFIMLVNEMVESEHLNEICEAVGDADKLKEIQNNGEYYFSTAGLEGYHEYNLEEYAKHLGTLTDKEALKTDGKYDAAKLKAALIDVVNVQMQNDVKYEESDISWDMALELYKYAIENDGALMYDSSIMSTIGDYNNKKGEEPAVEGKKERNTCNMYKILLLMRQLQPDHCISEILPNLDEVGVYYPEGLGKGTGVNAWDCNTFCKNDGSAIDYSDIREPLVVGPTYGLKGGTGSEYVAGADSSYVYKRIYSYTGEQFFAGAKFIGDNKDDDDNFLSKNTAANDKPLATDATWNSEAASLLADADKGGVIRYIMDMKLYHYDSYPIRILELQPFAGNSQWDNEATAKRLNDWMGLGLAINSGNYKQYFQITRMSMKEFNSRQDDINGIYDMIYLGMDTGYHPIDTSTKKTKFRDSKMNGLLYYGLGDKMSVASYFRGTAKGDYQVKTSYSLTGSTYAYWKNNYGPVLGTAKNSADGSGYFTGGITGNGYVIKNSGTEERLIGNDMTVKSSDRLKDYVMSGYPLLIEESLVVDNNSTVMPNTTYVSVNSKMYYFMKDIFNMTGIADGYQYANIVRVADSGNPYAKKGTNPVNDSNAAKLFRGGLRYALKRSTKVAFQLVKSPQQYHYKSTTNGKVYSPLEAAEEANARVPAGSLGTYVEENTYEFVVDVNSVISAQELRDNYSYQIYIDKSGVGQFDPLNTLKLDPHPSFRKVTETVDGKQVTKMQVVLTGKWPGKIEGYVPWRVEIAQNNNQYNYYTYTGYSAFKVENRKTVYVLWVRPINSYNTLDFAKQVNSIYSDESDTEEIREYRDYDIKIITLTYSEFIKMWSKESVDQKYTKDNTKLKILNAYNHRTTNEFKKAPYCTITQTEAEANENTEFNMIVVGFSDSYGDLDIASIPALNNLKYFEEAGNSILFTHDNANYVTTINYMKSNGAELNGGWGRYASPILRNMLGMDAFGSGISVEEAKDPIKWAERQRARMYLSGYNEEDFRGHTSMYSSYIAYANYDEEQMEYSASLYSSTPVNFEGFQSKEMVSTSVDRMNRGQLTDYPFIIGDQLDVTPTHAQYLALNMDAEDMTVWYTLGSTWEKQNVDLNQNGSIGNGEKNIQVGLVYGAAKGDGANNYYIYSKGNVTYTGAGHLPIKESTNMNEIKLFINTVVAAIKAGNYEPEVIFPDAESNRNGQNVVDHYPAEESSMVVNFQPIDYDSMEGVESFSECKIYLNVGGSDDYDPGIDIPLFLSASESWIYEPGTKNKLDLTGTKLKNKLTYGFEIPPEVMAELMKDDKLYKYPIVIKITDAGYKGDTSKKKTVYSKLYVSKAELHNLR